MFPQLSENTANTVYWLGWFLVLISAMMGLAGSALGFWGDKERERYSDLRLSDNEKQIEVAKAQAALANERATKSALDLEKLRVAQASRMTRLLDGHFPDLTKGAPTGSVKIWYVPENDDAFNLSHFLFACLSGSGWKGSSPIPIPSLPASDKWGDETQFARASGGMIGGNAIVIRCSKLSDWRNEHSPIGTLMKCFEKAGVQVGIVPEEMCEQLTGSPDEIGHSLAQDEALIVVGNKY